MQVETVLDVQRLAVERQQHSLCPSYKSCQRIPLGFLHLFLHPPGKTSGNVTLTLLVCEHVIYINLLSDAVTSVSLQQTICCILVIMSMTITMTA